MQSWCGIRSLLRILRLVVFIWHENSRNKKQLHVCIVRAACVHDDDWCLHLWMFLESTPPTKEEEKKSNIEKDWMREMRNGQDRRRRRPLRTLHNSTEIHHGITHRKLVWGEREACSVRNEMEYTQSNWRFWFRTQLWICVSLCDEPRFCFDAIPIWWNHFHPIQRLRVLLCVVFLCRSHLVIFFFAQLALRQRNKNVIYI